MGKTYIKRFIRREVVEKIIIMIASTILIYLLISLYFVNHFFFNTIINGVNVSLKSYEDAEQKIRNHMNEYELDLIERNGEREKIQGQEIGIQYNEKNSINKIFHLQYSFHWINSILRIRRYNVRDIIVINEEKLNQKINKLKCMNKAVTEPHNVSFQYDNGTFLVVKEEYGNKINKAKLKEAIKTQLLKGKIQLDMDEMNCYEYPKYTINSLKTARTLKALNKYIATNITYQFGSKYEILDGNTINRWLNVDNNLDVKISEAAAKLYVKGLSAKYDTVGITRNFKTSTGKIVEVTGGLFGWKIDQNAEVEAIIKSIKHGEVIKKEPIYKQKGISRDDNEIGDTYVEINITKQFLWFYKDGKLLAKGSVVTGNPNRGNATVLGFYMLNYKQKDVVISGPGYSAKVTYWMPFFGNIGLHDASWRSSFGGEIYKRNGSHGCVNAPYSLAKIVFENIVDGTPIICYEE